MLSGPILRLFARHLKAILMAPANRAELAVCATR